MAGSSVSDRMEVDSTVLARVTRALRKEGDGKELTRGLIRELRHVAEPALVAVKGAILSMGSHAEVEPGLRTTIARAAKISVRTTGKRPGISIKVGKSSMPRGFRNAPKRTNDAKGWRHPVFGKDQWVSQRGKPGWFDDTLKAFREPAKEAASRAIHDAARRISERSKV